VRHLETVGRGYRIKVRHPALNVFVLPVDSFKRLPRHAGVYVLIDQRCGETYVGQSTSLRSRVPNSRVSNLPDATHVIAVTGAAWDLEGELNALECALIGNLPCVNHMPGAGRSSTDADGFLSAVMAEMLHHVRVFLPPISPTPLTQAETARTIVADSPGPMTVGEVLGECRLRGYPYEGRTPHKTLRRDLCEPTRGGSSSIVFVGPHSQPSTLIVDQRLSPTEDQSPTLVSKCTDEMVALNG